MTFSPIILSKQLESAKKRETSTKQQKPSVTTSSMSRFMMFGSKFKPQTSINAAQKRPWRFITDPFNS